MQIAASDFVRIDIALLRAAIVAALLRAGCDDANARATADVMVRAEEDGCSSHGLFRLPGFLAALNCGKARGDVTPDVTQLAPGVIRIDGKRGLSPLAT
jgi:delta1-piperideine-2-carboxylate reductase